MKLDKYDPKVAYGADTTDSRPVLQCVCLRDGKLVSADGFMLVIREATFEDGDKLKDNEQLLFPADIMKLLKPSFQKTAIMVMEEDGSITVTYRHYKTNEVIEPVLSFRPSNIGTFPNYTQLFPKGTKHYQYAVSVGLLRKLLRCLPKEGILRLGFAEKSSDPVEFVCHPDDSGADFERPIRGLVMPMFVNWDEVDWLNSKENKE